MPLNTVGARVAHAGFMALLLAGASGAAMAQAPDATGAAAPDPREARIEQLETEVQQLAAEVQDLKRNQAEQIQTLANVEEKVPPPPSAVVSILNGRPTIASADGKFTATLHGVMQLDTADYDQASPGPTSTDFRRDGPALGGSTSNVDANHARDLKNGDVFRRARIGIDGAAFGDWDYRVLFDFAGAGAEDAGQLYESWVQYSGLKPFHFRVGAFSPSIGMEDQASTNAMPFLERSVAEDLARGLAAGDTRTAAELWATGDHWLVSGAVTGRTIGVVNTGTVPATLSSTAGIGTAQSYGDQVGVVGRVAATPLHGKDWLIHVGLHGSYVLHPADVTGPTGTNGSNLVSAEVIALSNTPELRVDGAKLLNTGNIDASHADTIGAEFAAQKQNFLLQGEYENFGVQRDDGQPSPTFHGYYVEGTWVLTGEARKYNSATGAFDGPVIAHPFDWSHRGWGAWEVAARYSDMDLNFDAGKAGTAVPTAANPDIRGGEEQNVTVGLNWYPNAVVRFMLDYANVDISRLSPGAIATNASVWLLPANHYGQQIGQRYNVFSLRSQVAF